MATANTTLTGPDDAETLTSLFEQGPAGLVVPSRIGNNGWQAYGTAWYAAGGSSGYPGISSTAYGRIVRLKATGTAGTNASVSFGADPSSGRSMYFNSAGEFMGSITGTVADAAGSVGSFWLGFGTPGNAGSDLTPIKTAAGDDFINERFVLGANQGDSQLRVGWGAPAVAGMTAVTLNGGSGFPISNAADMYLFHVHYFPSTAAGGRRVEWVAKNLTTGLAVTGTATSNLPPGTTLLGPVCLRSSGSDAVTAPALESAGYATGSWARGFFF